jgi:cell division protein FtsL
MLNTGSRNASCNVGNIEHGFVAKMCDCLSLDLSDGGTTNLFLAGFRNDMLSGVTISIVLLLAVVLCRSVAINYLHNTQIYR